MSESVPKGWKIDRFEGQVEILSGFPFKSEFFTDNPEHIGLIRIRDLLRQRTETFYTGDYPDEFVMDEGDVLVGMDGDFNVVKWRGRPALLNQRICRIDAKPESQFVKDFLFHTLKEDLIRIQETTGATTVKHLSVKDLRNIEKPFPPRPEQQKIASILTSVDNVIEKTEAQISKLQDLKKGVMTELLTKGIGHTEFKDSPVGRIPKEWDVMAIGDLSTKVVDGPHKTPTYVEQGIPFVTVKNMITGKLIFHHLKYITPEDHEEFCKRSKAEIGDILYSKDGSIGQTCVIHTDRPFSYFVSVALIKLNKHLISPYFANIALQSDNTWNQVGIMSEGSGLKHMVLRSIKALRIPVPNLEEQREIFEIIDSIRLLIDNKVSQVNLYRSTKKALMQDLLTGKVRVKVN